MYVCMYVRKKEVQEISWDILHVITGTDEDEDILAVVDGDRINGSLNRLKVTVTVNIDGDKTVAGGTNPFVPPVMSSTITTTRAIASSSSV